ncbi:MAG: uracil-DNA glycosylase family protein [Clostridium sp.]|nr:uracil-DNA glycosylase family protein [Clostridium sp.]
MEKIIETHPWEPFLPENAKILIMGTFPPGEKRWSMDFYYPNPINDFWRIMGLIFLGNKDALWDGATKTFRLPEIKALMREKGIALNDTARKVCRLKGNASDKYLEILEPAPLYELLGKMPLCHNVATTGEKAAQVVAGLTSTAVPKMGEYVTTDEGLRIWRMPSTSRAYPMKLEKKAEYYRRMLEDALGETN